MKLSELGIRNSEQAETDPEVKSIHYNTRDIEESGLFVAIRGLKADGHDFINQAIEKGASAIVTQKPYLDKYKEELDKHRKEKGEKIPIFPVVAEVEDTRKALAEISSRFYGNPSEKLFIIGITGTNGKTTTTYLIESILEKAGYNVGVIGTVNYRYSGKIFDNPVTTPDSSDLQCILAEMLKHGVTHVVMEASSHAIDLFRLERCWLDIGVFTNLSQDHLDYHKDMDSYWSCKKRLFTENLGMGAKKSSAVINCSNAKGKELVRFLADNNKAVNCWQLLISHEQSAPSNRPEDLRGFQNPVGLTSNQQPATSNQQISADNYKTSLDGITGKISTHNGSFDFRSLLIGKHNLENILCAAGVGAVLDLSPDVIKAGIEAATSTPGRLERVSDSAGNKELFVYVDYAHTPDALENVLTSLCSLTSDSRVICVFGCGGDRDAGKRPQMGSIAGRLCNLAIVTSDNPRTEEPVEIIDQILEGMKLETGNWKLETQVLHEYELSDLENGFEKKGYVVEPDRRKAIQLGIRLSRPGDVIIIAGKGHETYQIIGNKTVHFDDREEAEKALMIEN
ncbi:MAG: UDP-N-acetylmuramoyl-L-alanyl-D-glutamate--2,6-diaminopimelate ligase [Desulfobacteraceae bacterium]|nr:UDP-N-acetylmuramoyl-L-alanyl-D-glutamate--2,6-diaminopimelate ligase [Desulfobacteraceae bacterium]